MDIMYEMHFNKNYTVKKSASVPRLTISVGER